MALYDPLLEPASTMSPGTVQTKQVVTETIELHEKTITELSHDYTDSDTKSIPSSKALFEAIQVLDKYINSIDPNNILYQDNAVITLPLLPLTFEYGDTEWVYEGWYPDGGKLIYTGTDYANSIKISPEKFTYPGYYFLVIDIDRLDSGKLVVKDTKEEVIESIATTGKTYIELDITNTDVNSVTFEAVDVYPRETLRVASIGLYRVTTRVRDYLQYFFLGNKGSLITKDELDDLLEALNVDIDTRLDKYEDDVDEKINLHIQNTSNPHNVTIDQIGAAAKEHTHTPDQCGAAPTVHTHQPQECGAAPEQHTHDQYTTPEEVQEAIEDAIGKYDESSDTTLFTKHLTDYNNPHKVNCETIGAAEKEHTHENYLTKEDVGTYVNSAVEESAASLMQQLTEHIEDTDNPHEVTPEQIGAAPSEHEHEQYVERDELDQRIEEIARNIQHSSSLPMTIVEPSEYGVLPDNTLCTRLSRPISPVLLPYVVHRTKSNYDYYDGVCRSNRVTDEGHPLYYCFNKSMTQEDRDIAVGLFTVKDDTATVEEDLTSETTNKFNVSESNPLILEYQFHTARQVSGFSLEYNNNYTKIVASKYKLYVNDRPIEEYDTTIKKLEDTLTDPDENLRQTVTFTANPVTTPEPGPEEEVEPGTGGGTDAGDTGDTGETGGSSSPTSPDESTNPDNTTSQEGEDSDLDTASIASDDPSEVVDQVPGTESESPDGSGEDSDSEGDSGGGSGGSSSQGPEDQQPEEPQPEEQGPEEGEPPVEDVPEPEPSVSATKFTIYITELKEFTYTPKEPEPSTSTDGEQTEDTEPEASEGSNNGGAEEGIQSTALEGVEETSPADEEKSKHFGCKVKFKFTDVSDSEVAIQSGYTYSLPHGEFSPYMTTSAPLTVGDGRNKYLYVISDSNDTTSIDNIRLEVSDTPMNYTYADTGVSVLTDMYNSYSNGTWGTITVVEEDTKNDDDTGSSSTGSGSSGGNDDTDSGGGGTGGTPGNTDDHSGQDTGETETGQSSEGADAGADKEAESPVAIAMEVGEEDPVAGGEEDNQDGSDDQNTSTDTDPNSNEQGNQESGSDGNTGESGGEGGEGGETEPGGSAGGEGTTEPGGEQGPDTPDTPDEPDQPIEIVDNTSHTNHPIYNIYSSDTSRYYRTKTDKHSVTFEHKFNTLTTIEGIRLIFSKSLLDIEDDPEVQQEELETPTPTPTEPTDQETTGTGITGTETTDQDNAANTESESKQGENEVEADTAASISEEPDTAVSSESQEEEESSGTPSTEKSEESSDEPAAGEEPKEPSKISLIPDSISISGVYPTYVDSDGNEQTVPEEVIYKNDHFVPYVSSEDNIIIDIPTHTTGIDTLRVQLSSKSHAVGLTQLEVYSSRYNYNISKNECNYSNLVYPLGTLRYVKGLSNQSDYYIYNGAAVGTDVYIPINGLDPIKVYTEPVAVTIPNPYNTSYIDCDLYSYVNNTIVRVGNMDISTITSEEITIHIGFSGRYLVNIRRRF